jgi:very-short-patch-repair endonuclease
VSGKRDLTRRVAQASDGAVRSGQVVSCAGCKREFYVYPSERGRKYCSPVCRRNREERSCAICGDVFVAKIAHRKKTCGDSCAKQLKARASAARWKVPAIREKSVAGLSKAALSDPRRAEQLNSARKHLVWTDEHKAKLRAARLKQRLPTRATSIELRLGAAMAALGIRFREQVPMFGRAIPDFVLDEPKVIVQADGIYWHSLPAAIKKDAAFDATARKAGWEVLRFTDKQINADAAACAAQVAELATARLEHALGYSFVPRESLRAEKPPSQPSLFERTA